jgi:hypothetical protein
VARRRITDDGLGREAFEGVPQPRTRRISYVSRTEGSQTRRWRKADSNPRSRPERDGRGEGARSHRRLATGHRIQLVVPGAPFGNTRQSLSQERDRGIKPAFRLTSPIGPIFGIPRGRSPSELNPEPYHEAPVKGPIPSYWAGKWAEIINAAAKIVGEEVIPPIRSRAIPLRWIRLAVGSSSQTTMAALAGLNDGSNRGASSSPSS